MAEYRIWIDRAQNPISFFGRTMAQAQASARRHVRRMRNIEMGYYDRKGTFHPIRASRDYSSSRAGEGRSRKRRAKKRRRR